MKKGQIIEGVIERVDFPNKGIIRTEDGRQVIVKNTIPGQRVSASINKIRKGKAEGRLLEVLEKSPLEGDKTGCVHAGECGGCTYQTLPYDRQLEMKAEQGKLIYPRQIKRELGAKIIYDAICPVASKAFYGFNPYEKENYGNMVAEDIGNSYGRCNQIADASIEIEKKIKELSEKELQNEKVIIDILRKCFEDKEDIASMAEGDNLEMLVEKVMELVRNLYL